MKKLVLLSILLIALSVTLFAEKIKLRVAYEDKEQPPYYMQNTSEVPKTNPGISVEMVMLLKKYIPELEIEFTRMPWKRCTYSLGENQVDAIFNSSYSKERLDIGWYPTTNKQHTGQVDKDRRLTTISYFLYANKNAGIKWDGKLESLTQIIGAPMGYSIVNDLKNKGVKVEEAQDSMTNLMKVAKGRIDAAALQDVTADDILKNNKKEMGNIVKLNPPVVSKEYYLMLSKKFVQDNPALAQKIWDTIKVIREKEFKNLSSKYNKV
ncbi:MAG TPA: transporter substrate-binding domain-containing protein [Candidatus Cloacimonadota bacterium]|nr:transporter substrate-binding domain-containing protein [Candidatus Cloacimonadota bacterium]